MKSNTSHFYGAIVLIILSLTAIEARPMLIPQKNQDGGTGDLCMRIIDFCTSKIQEWEESYDSAPPQFREKFAIYAEPLEQACNNCVSKLSKLGLEGTCLQKAMQACGYPRRKIWGY
jgi:hypothetical protein